MDWLQPTLTAGLIMLGCAALFYWVGRGGPRKPGAIRDADDYVSSGRNVSMTPGGASMGATWIWSASIFATVTAAYSVGLAGAFQYGFWAGLCLIAFIPWGRKLRAMAPKGHTFPEFIRLRHGSFAQVVLLLENLLNSQYSLIVNFTAGATVLAVVTGVSYPVAVTMIALVLLSYAPIAGLRGSVRTDMIQLVGLLLLTLIAVPWLLFELGGAGGIAQRLDTLAASGDPADQARTRFLSAEAFLSYGAVNIMLVLAYAFGNPAVWQRVWAIREDRLASAYAFGGASYIAVVVGLGLFGLGALLLGVQPVVPPGADTPDNNTLLPVMLEQIAPAALAIPFLFLLLGALFSTADSDVNALASIAMTDLWRDRLRPQAGHRELVLVGRATMLLAVVLGLAVAMLRLDILAMILFVGMVRAAAVFPVAATLMRWPVNGLGFGLGIVIGAAAGVTTYFLTADGAAALDAAPRAATLLGAVAATGPGVLALCLLAPYLGRWALLPATLAGLATLPFAAGVVEYQFLASSMVSLGVAGVACAAVSAATRSDASFDWSRLRSIPALGAAHPTPKPAAAEPPA